MSTRIQFTHQEKTIKKHSQAWIIGQAKAVLNDKGIKGLCTNKLPQNYGELYTTEEASEIIADLVDDSLFYGGYWM